MILHLSLILSTGGSCILACTWADIPPGRHPRADTPQPDTPGQTPHWADTPGQTATAAGGTHPTGMHSCLTMK